MRLLKRTVPVIVTGGFFVAALFLVGLVLNPVNAGTPNQEGIETSLLFSVDQPVTPVPRTIQLEDETNGEAGPTDLATELNSWTFTNHPGPHEPGGHHPPPHPKPPPPPRPPHHPVHPPHRHHTPHH